MKRKPEKAKEYMTLVSRKYSIEQCRINFDALFVFEDNLARSGYLGDSLIREQRNAIGICIAKSIKEPWEDSTLDDNCKHIEEDVERIKKYFDEFEFKAMAFPFSGIGMINSHLHVNAPLTFCYLSKRLMEEFKFNNFGNLLKS